jgi:hypothetical protein
MYMHNISYLLIFKYKYKLYQLSAFDSFLCRSNFSEGNLLSVKSYLFKCLKNAWCSEISFHLWKWLVNSYTRLMSVSSSHRCPSDTTRQEQIYKILLFFFPLNFLFISTWNWFTVICLCSFTSLVNCQIWMKLCIRPLCVFDVKIRTWALSVL